MASGPKLWTEEVIQDRFARGYGHGTRESYIPWQHVREFSSIGNATRVPSLLFPRSIQTFSYLERYMYLYLEFQGGVMDYREQFPMDRRVTMEAARRLKVRHPVYPKTGIPAVMNVDAIVTRADETAELWDAKTTYKLASKRVQGKLKLHKAFGDAMGFNYNLFTEKTVPKRKLRNIDLIRSAMPKTGEQLVPVDLFSRHWAIVREACVRNSRTTIQRFCLDYDRANQLPLGSALRLMWCLLWTRQLVTDLNVDHLQLTPLSSIRFGSH